MVTIFWGAGIIGKRQFGLWKKLNRKVDFFGDNDPKKRGTFYCGREVLSIERVLQMQDYMIYITCSAKIRDQVYEELINNGIEETRIVSDCGLSDIFIKMQEDLKQKVSSDKRNHKLDLVFDLQNGLALGGVETWAFDSAELLEGMGYHTGYLVNSYANNWYLPKTGEIINVPNTPDMDFYSHSMLCAEKLLEIRPEVVLINFPQTIFLAACVIKNLIPDQIKVIAVVHNDEKTYYDLYTSFEKYIDCFLIISNKIKKEMIERGIKESKIQYLPWYVYADKMAHQYSKESEPIRLGYAGRITLIQKRADLLTALAVELRKRNVDFLFDIAGNGDYMEILRQEVVKYSLSEYVLIHDYIPHNEIYEFWKDKDICVNLSDFEGRSISKAEAMAAGVVPVVTDTSGMKDDIINEYNGYIVPLEAVGLAAEKIEYLYKNRKNIVTMGLRAHDAIKQNNSMEGVLAFWDKAVQLYLENRSV